MKKTKIHTEHDDPYKMLLKQFPSSIRLAIEGHIPDPVLVELLDCSSASIKNSKEAFEDLKNAWKNDKHIDEHLVRRAVRFFPRALGYAPNDIQDALLDDIMEDLFRKTDGARAWKIFERMVDSYISVLEKDVEKLFEQQTEIAEKAKVMQSKFVETGLTITVPSSISQLENGYTHYYAIEHSKREQKVVSRKEKFPNIVIDVYLPQDSWDKQKYIERALSNGKCAPMKTYQYWDQYHGYVDHLYKFFHNHRVNYHKHNMRSVSSYNILFSFSRFPSHIEKEYARAEREIGIIVDNTQTTLNNSLSKTKDRIRLIPNSPYPKTRGPVPVLTRLNSLYSQMGQSWREKLASWGASWGMSWLL